MKRLFIETREFSKKWKLLGMTEEDLTELQHYLLDNPAAGKVMQSTGGVRKVRWAKNRGKSGGIRTLYIDFTNAGRIYFITVFGKNEKDNLSASEKKVIKEFVKEL